MQKSTLYKNCQRQRCSAINCLSSDINILAGDDVFPLKSWLRVMYPLLIAASLDTFCLVITANMQSETVNYTFRESRGVNPEAGRESMVEKVCEKGRS